MSFPSPHALLWQRAGHDLPIITKCSPWARRWNPPRLGEFWGHTSFWSIPRACFKSGCSHFSSGGVRPYDHILYVRQKTTGYPQITPKMPRQGTKHSKICLSIKITYMTLSNSIQIKTRNNHGLCAFVKVSNISDLHCCHVGVQNKRKFDWLMSGHFVVLNCTWYIQNVIL